MPIELSQWATPTGWGLAGALFLLLATGRLVARSWAKDLAERADRDAERWRAAAEASDRRADEMVRLQGETLQALRSVESLVRALPGGRRDDPS